jgi:hypothetical protein
VTSEVEASYRDLLLWLIPESDEARSNETLVHHYPPSFANDAYANDAHGCRVSVLVHKRKKP